MYNCQPRLICLMFERQLTWRAFSRAWANTGNRMAARIAIIAITTSNSISVNPNLFHISPSSWRPAPSVERVPESPKGAETIDLRGGVTSGTTVSPHHRTTALARLVLRITGHDFVAIGAEPDAVPTQVERIRLHRLDVAVQEADV